MKRLTLSLLLGLVSTLAFAQFTTAGDGTLYTIQSLAAIGEAGITVVTPPASYSDKTTYQLNNSITIAEGDQFEMDDDVLVLLNDDVVLTIQGEAAFQPEPSSTFSTVNNDHATGASIRIESSKLTPVEHCVFSGVGVEVMGEGGISMLGSSFDSHDGSKAAALYFISAGATSTVGDCSFSRCAKAAIGSAANASQPLIIKDCTFDQNSTANGNIPQINITVANQLEITGCTIIGDPDNNMVGGIGISNFYGYADASVLISGCTISDNRYGIGLVGPAANIRIEDCILMNNRYETNPMNGGSGISLYDPYLQTAAIISGNHIEGSLWGVTVIGCKDVNLGQPDNSDIDSPGGNVFKNNGNGGQLYDLYNNSQLTVYAQNNLWNVTEQTEEQIETVVFHQADDPSLGEVIYWPASAATGITEPSSLLPSPSSYYDLQGRTHQTPQKGINIVNGKKVVY